MLKVRWNPRPAGLALPTPEKLEALAVPADKGFGRHHGQCVSPIEPPTEPDERQAGWIVGSSGLDFAFPIEGELFAQKEILSRERAFRSQAESNQAEQIAEDGEPTQAGLHAGPGSFYRRCSPLQIGPNFVRFKPVQEFLRRTDSVGEHQRR